MLLNPVGPGPGNLMHLSWPYLIACLISLCEILNTLLASATENLVS